MTKVEQPKAEAATEKPLEGPPVLPLDTAATEPAVAASAAAAFGHKAGDLGPASAVPMRKPGHGTVVYASESPAIALQPPGGPDHDSNDQLQVLATKTARAAGLNVAGPK